MNLIFLLTFQNSGVLSLGLLFQILSKNKNIYRFPHDGPRSTKAGGASGVRGGSAGAGTGAAPASSGAAPAPAPGLYPRSGPGCQRSGTLVVGRASSCCPRDCER